MGRATGFPSRVTEHGAARRQQTPPGASGWTDAKLETELRAFTAGRTTFPTRREFDSASRADLRCAVANRGGAVPWAARLGLALTPSQLAHLPYEEDEAVDDARRVIAKVGRLPGSAKLRRMGYGRLARAVQVAGGARRFCAVHALPGRPADA